MPAQKHQLSKMRLVPYEHDSKVLKQILKGIDDIKASNTHDTWDSLTQPAEMKQLKQLEAYHDKIMKMNLPPTVQGEILSRLLVQKTKLEQTLKEMAPTTHKTNQAAPKRWSGDATDDSTLVSRRPFASFVERTPQIEDDDDEEEEEEKEEEDDDDEEEDSPLATTSMPTPSSFVTPLKASTPKAKLQRLQKRKPVVQKLKHQLEDLRSPHAQKYAQELDEIHREETRLQQELSTIGKRVKATQRTKKRS